jgi:glycerophosphoryl diester phosphodiesterase
MLDFDGSPTKAGQLVVMHDWQVDRTTKVLVTTRGARGQPVVTRVRLHP